MYEGEPNIPRVAMISSTFLSVARSKSLKWGKHCLSRKVSCRCHISYFSSNSYLNTWWKNLHRQKYSHTKGKIMNSILHSFPTLVREVVLIDCFSIEMHLFLPLQIYLESVKFSLFDYLNFQSQKSPIGQGAWKAKDKSWAMPASFQFRPPSSLVDKGINQFYLWITNIYIYIYTCIHG